VRAYATNSEGTSYGEQHEFMTTNCPVDPPTVATAEIINITQTSAQGGGDVTDNGGAPVTAKGICWGTIQNPTLEDLHTEDGSGIGSFTSVMTGLECGVTYYVRAYATNSGGTSYGSQETFSTALCTFLPSVITLELTNITDLTAEGGGEVTDDGNLSITARGVCWSTSAGPEVTDSKTVDGEGIGTFTSQVEGLSPSTQYYLRAYATNSEGTVYGEEKEFTTWEGSVTDYDGNVYGTVVIGEQTWMGSNLKVTHYSDGTMLPLLLDSLEWLNLPYNEKAYCWYDNMVSNGNTYGAIYSFTAAMNGIEGTDANPGDIQGVCPSGWHMPSDAEWKEMEIFLGMDPAEAENTQFRGTDEGGKLKETGTQHWGYPNFGATNLSGFTALPAGIRSNDGGFFGIEGFTYFWTASGTAGFSISRGLDSDSQQIIRIPSQWNFGYAVRCVKDK